MRHEWDKEGLRKWSKGNLRWKEERSMDDRSESDSFLKDALEGLRQFPEFEHEENLNRLERKIGPKERTRIIPIFWRRIAAVLIIALGISSIWLLNRPNLTESDLSMESIEVEEDSNDDYKITSPNPGIVKPADEIQEIPSPVVAPIEPAPILPPIEEDSYIALEDQITSPETEAESAAINPPPRINADEIASAQEDISTAPSKRERIPTEYSVVEEALTETRAPASIETLPKVQMETLVSGTVIDPNGLPVAGATVVDKNSQESVLTNTKGIFRLNAIPTDSGQAIELDVNHFNYQDTTLKIQGYTLSSIQLAEKQDRIASGNTQDDLSQQPYPEGGFALFMERFQAPQLDGSSAKKTRTRSRKKRKAAAEVSSTETVTLVFTVFQNGRITDVQLLDGRRSNDDNILEVIDILENGPRWIIPAQQDSVRTQITLPLNR